MEIIDGISLQEIAFLYPISTLTKDDYDLYPERYKRIEEMWRKGFYKEQIMYRIEKRKADLWLKKKK